MAAERHGGKGLDGLELKYNGLLSGRAGFARETKDAQRRPIGVDKTRHGDFTIDPGRQQQRAWGHLQDDFVTFLDVQEQRRLMQPTEGIAKRGFLLGAQYLDAGSQRRRHHA